MKGRLSDTGESRLLNIGIVDADLLDNGTRHPNLALLKIGGYCKEKNLNYKLLYEPGNLNDITNYDIVVVSKVFTFSKIPPKILSIIGNEKLKWKQYNLCTLNEINLRLKSNEKMDTVIIIGGTGFFEDGGINLADEIEHHMPDYDLYKEYIDSKVADGRSRAYFSDYEEYSIGFTTRGCFRKCEFCVNKKYNKALKHSPVNEFLDENRPYINLWDDNFFAFFHGWEQILDELESTKKPFQFRQGLDIRLLTEQHAKRLTNCKYRGDFIFAFDHIEDKEKIIEKLKLWRKHTRRTTKLYVLCAFDPQNDWDGKTDFNLLEKKDIESVFERIKILMEYGCLPYVMRYESYKDSKYRGLYTQIARWCNQPQFFKKKSFRQFCVANQEYQGNSETTCSALQSMLDFEKECPGIAKKYFDLRFDDLNQYKSKASYGRKETFPCAFCKEERITWDDVHNKKYPSSEIVNSYLSGKLDFLCLNKDLTVECSTDASILASEICNVLLDVGLNGILEIIDSWSNGQNFDISTVPQFSDIQESTHRLLKDLDKGSELTYLDIGTLLDYGELKTDSARRKYGENHAKLASLLDLVWINDSTKGKIISIAPLGKYLLSVEEIKKQEIIRCLYFRIPIIQKIFKDAKQNEVQISSILEKIMPNKTTIERRKSSIFAIVREIAKSSDLYLYDRISKIN
jgi:hypothetical protein